MDPTDGKSSVWADGDRIGVRIGDNEETGIYVMNVDAEGRVVGVTPEKAVYWKDKEPATITAWYPLDEELDFTHQDNGLYLQPVITQYFVSYKSEIWA